MDSNEVVIAKVQGERSVVVLPLLAEGVGQAGKSADECALPIPLRRASPSKALAL